MLPRGQQKGLAGDACEKGQKFSFQKGKAGLAHRIGGGSMLFGDHSHMAVRGEHVPVQSEELTQKPFDSISDNGFAHLARNGHPCTCDRGDFRARQDKTQEMWTVETSPP